MASLNLPITIQFDLSRLQSAARSLGSALSSLGAVGNTAFSSMTSAVNKFHGYLSKLPSTLKLITSSFKGLKSIISTTFNFRNIVNLSKSMLELSSSLIEVQNVVDTTFGSMSSVINDFANSSMRSLGLSELQIKQYTSTYGSMLKAMGVSGSALTDMSIGLTELVSGVASFKDISADEAFTKLRSVITGETEPLKDLGVVMTQTALESYRLANGYTTAYKSMSSAEQVTLRFNFVMNALQDTLGDFSDTFGSWSNQTKYLTNQLQQLGAMLGNLLQKILYPFLVVLNNLVSYAINAVTALSKLFGFDSTSLQISQGVASNTADTIADIVTNTEDATDAQKALNSEQKKSLATIHKLNVLSSNQAAGSSSSASPGSSFATPSFDLSFTPSQTDVDSEVTGFLADLKRLFENGDFEGVGALLAQKLNEELKKVDFNEMFAKLRDKLSKALRIINGFVENFDWDVFGAKVAQFFNGLVSLFIEYVTTLDFGGLGRALATAIKGALIGSEDGSEEGFNFDQLAEAFVGAFLALRDFLVEFVTNFPKEELVNGIKAFFSGVVQRLSEEVETDDDGKMTVAQSIGVAIADAVNLGIDILYEIVSSDAFKSFVSYLWDILITAIKEIDWKSLLDTILETFDSLPDELQAAVGFMSFGAIASLFLKLATIFNTVSPLLTTLAPLFSSLGSAIATVIGKVGSFLSSSSFGGVASVILGVIEAAGAFFDMWQNGFSIASEVAMLLGIAITAIGAILLGAPAFVAGIVAGVVAVVANLVLYVREHFDEIKEFCIGVVGKIKEGFGSAIESVKGFFTDLGQKIKDIVDNIKDWFSSVYTSIKEGFGSAIESVKGFFTDLGTTFKTIINDMLGVVESFINFFINGINKLIDGLNSLSFDIPDWIPGIGGNTFSLGIPSIPNLSLPRLAKGAVIPPNNQFLAVLGDQKRGVNIETPLETMLQAFRGALAEGSYAEGVGDIIIPIYINNELSSEEIIRKQDIARYRSNGK